MKASDIMRAVQDSEEVVPELVTTQTNRVDVSHHPTARRMIAAARRILVRDGFAGLTLEAVSKEAGVNKAATRYYFGGKEGLIEAVVREIVLEDCANVEASAAPDATSAERISTFIDNTRDVATDAEAFGGFFEILPQGCKSERLKRELSQLYLQWFTSSIEWLGLDDDALSAQAKRGLGMFITAVVDGLAVQEMIFDPSYEPESCLAVFREVLWALVEDRPLREALKGI